MTGPLFNLLFKEVEKELKKVARDVINVVAPGKGDELLPPEKPTVSVEDIVYKPKDTEKGAKVPAALPVKTGDDTLGFRAIIINPLMGDFAGSRLKITNTRTHESIIVEPVYDAHGAPTVNKHRFIFLSPQAMSALNATNNAFVLISWTKNNLPLGVA